MTGSKAPSVVIDIDVLKRAVGVAEWARDYAAGIVEAVPVAAHRLTMICAHLGERAFTRIRRHSGETEEEHLRLEGGAWNIQELRDSSGRCSQETRLQGLDLEASSQASEEDDVALRALGPLAHRSAMILLAIEDITDRKRGNASAPSCSPRR